MISLSLSRKKKTIPREDHEEKRFSAFRYFMKWKTLLRILTQETHFRTGISLKITDERDAMGTKGERLLTRHLLTFISGPRKCREK